MWGEQREESSDFLVMDIPALPLRLTLACPSGPQQCQRAGQKEKGEAGFLVCLASARGMSPFYPSFAGRPHWLLSPSAHLRPPVPPGCSGATATVPPPAPPAGPKGGVTHGAATSPRLARGV